MENNRHIALRLCAFAVFFLCILATSASAQDPITVKAFVTEDHDILVRFAPAEKNMMDLGKKYGYSIERDGQPLFKTPLLPWPENDTAWVELIRKETNAAFLYQSLYAGSKSNSTDPSERGKNEKSSFGLFLLTCDLSLNCAKATGLYFKDSTAVPGDHLYVIRISAASQKQAACSLHVDSRQPTPLKVISGTKGKFGDRIVKLSWNTSENKSDYCAYIIERSEDSIHFVSVNKTPYIQLYSSYEKNKADAFFNDSLPQNGKMYWYGIKGLSHFGVFGPPSTVIHGKGKEALRAFPIADSSRVKGNKVTLYWKMQDNKDKIAGYFISRSDRTNGDYKTISSLLPASTFSFTDEQPLFSNYYLINAVNTDGDSAHSFPVLVQLTDAEPPVSPIGLKGSIDKSGKVQLSWEPNKENDLKGYRVFRCNNLKEEMTEVTHELLPSPSFVDSITLQTLTPDVYYTVTAVDHVYNNSPYSSPLLLKRPDIVPPVAPLFKNVTYDLKGIRLNWIPSSSSDAEHYELSRSGNDSTLMFVIKWDATEDIHTFYDTALTQGGSYRYRLTVFDRSGNKNTCSSSVVNFENGVRAKISNMTCSVDRDARKIILNWTCTEKNIFSYVIYRSKKGEAPRIWKTVNGKLNKIEDKELYVNNIYVYQIKAVLNSGAETELSDPVEVNY